MSERGGKERVSERGGGERGGKERVRKTGSRERLSVRACMRACVFLSTAAVKVEAH